MQTLVRRHFSPASLSARALIWVLGSSLGAVAVGQETVPDEPDPLPERIARLSYTQGGVTLQAVGETAWAPAPMNRPMVTGDYLRTDASGRAELQMDEATVRMGAGTDFTFIALEDRALRMRMSAGVVYVRVRNLGENDVIEVETPQATASILRPGSYRLEVSESVGATVLKVSSGMMEARGAGQSVVVRAQQTATLTGSGGRFAYTTGTLGAPDSFDEWSLERDLRMDNSLAESSKYVPEDVVGYEDLDTYGEWRSEPEYGYVWSPRVVSGWSPYRFGRYTWVGGWGWTWIADEPWGFAPFHYGNWVTIGGRWCWVPGPRHSHPIGRPGRPGDDRHDWHIPTPPRGIATRAGVRGDADRDGTRPSFRTDRDDQVGGVTWAEREQGRASNGRWRTVPDGDRNRYVRPDQPQQAGSPGTAVGVPPAAAPTGEDRRIRIPRNEIPRADLPRNTFPRDDSRMRSGGDAGRMPQPRAEMPRAEMPRREMPRYEAPRPSPPPQQQQSTRPEMPRGGRDRDPPAGAGRPGSDRR